MRAQNPKPLDPPAAMNQTAVDEAKVGQLPEKLGVLVVDDDHLVRIMVQLGLERNGFDVRSASNGWEAIELYRMHRESIAVVLLDVCMTGLDGPQTLQGLRKVNPEVRACFMSGNWGSYEPDQLRQRGAAHVIAKPFMLDQLANILRLAAQGLPTDLPPDNRTRSEQNPG
jgi:DNA-binding NtrC family response regulator